MKKLAKALYLGLIIVFLYLPIGTLMVLSFNQSKSMAVWGGFSLKWYQEMFSNQIIMEAIWNTFTIALAAAAIATIVGTLACIGITAMRKKDRNRSPGTEQYSPAQRGHRHRHLSDADLPGVRHLPQLGHGPAVPRHLLSALRDPFRAA